MSEDDADRIVDEIRALTAAVVAAIEELQREIRELRRDVAGA